jgi:hypothetical protein
MGEQSHSLLLTPTIEHEKNFSPTFPQLFFPFHFTLRWLSCGELRTPFFRK